jgi:ribosomal protein S6--L-glutamate ligase
MTADMIKLGWEEWLALPDLGLPAIKAKIDTGARTSALSATHIEPFGSAKNPKIRFTVHPVPGQYDVAIACSAPLKDRRSVTSSNGEAELRYVIETTLQVGGQSWPIEVTLTDRDGMAYHMLLGRMALVERCVVVPGESHQQPDLSYDLYAQKTQPTRSRALRVALLTARPGTKSARALIAEAEARGHTVEPYDPATLTPHVSPTTPAILQDDTPLPRFDAVIARMKASRHNLAVLRQFEALGSYAPNSAEAVAAAADPLRARQILARHHIPIEEPGAPRTEDSFTATTIGKRLRSPQHKLTKSERATVLRAARALGLGFAALTLRHEDGQLIVQDVSASPQVTPLKKRKSIAAMLLDLIEKRARPKPGSRKRR